MNDAESKLQEIIIGGPYTDLFNFYQAHGIHAAISDIFDSNLHLECAEYLKTAYNHSTTTMALTVCRLFEPKHKNFEKRTLPYIFDFINENKKNIKLSQPYELNSIHEIFEKNIKHEEYIERQLVQWRSDIPIAPKSGESPKNELSKKLLGVKKFRDQHIAHNDIEATDIVSTYADMDQLAEWAKNILWYLEFLFFGVIQGNIMLTDHIEAQAPDAGRQLSSIVLLAIEAKTRNSNL